MRIHIEEMSWMEVKEALEQGFQTVIVPVASIEQHGPHLPLGTDSYGGDCYGAKVAVKLGNALVAPTIRFGCSMPSSIFPSESAASPFS